MALSALVLVRCFGFCRLDFSQNLSGRPDPYIVLNDTKPLHPHSDLIAKKVNAPRRPRGFALWCAGDLSLVKKPCVAVVGARQVSTSGAARARRLARELSQSGVVVVSGLALGVDTEALTAALEARGRTIAVIGTPIDKAYPAENKRLQELIYREHLLISQFPPGKKTYPSNFPERNKLMAAISDATVIVEASDTSGSLHQAAECLKLNRWLFIAKSVLEDRTLQWPSKFTHYPKTRPHNVTDDILSALSIREPSGTRMS